MVYLTVFSLFTSVAAADVPTTETFQNSIKMNFVRIEPGRFTMGFEGKALPKELPTKKGHFKNGDFDEKPAHQVAITKPFYMAVCEVTNAQYEKFDPNHQKYRGRRGYSKADDEAVVFVSWHDATAFCKWLSKKEQLPYRLPTEAEWEYACRAGTTTVFSTGDRLPSEFLKNNNEPLTVGKTAPNPWGLYDMHGNVEEWCCDWYGPYESGPQTDPVGAADGDFKVTRGGSHWTESYYLRSANRLGSHPDDRQWMIGFRVVMGLMPKAAYSPKSAPKRYQRHVSQTIGSAVGPDLQKPYFNGPHVFVRIGEGSYGPLFSEHNHFASVTECPNGDLLAAWFTCMDEMGRELGVAVSRLPYGQTQWQPASPFWDAPDRNDHTHALWYDGKGTIFHFNGLGVKYRNLALLLRKSTDNGVTWSKAKIILDHSDKLPNKIVESVFRAKTGEIVIPMDGAVIGISSDEGKTWSVPPGRLRGTHVGVTQLADGRLFAFGRHGVIDGKMPISISADMGKTWTYRAGPFQPIHSGRRVALMGLKEGPLFVASFCRGMMIKNDAGTEQAVTGLFAAISEDDGKTWPWRRPITDDGPGREIETMDGDPVMMDRRNSEPVGYLGVCQSADGLVHLVSSRNHYAFNLAWLKTAPPAASPQPPAPQKRKLPVKHVLGNIYRTTILPTRHNWAWNLNGGRNSPAESPIMSILQGKLLKIDTLSAGQFWLRTEKPEVFGAVDYKKGFTAEIRTKILKSAPKQRGIDLELYDGSGSRYAITITATGVYWYQGLIQGSAFLRFAQYVPIGQNLDNTDRMHTYRIAVRPDRVAQIYRDATLVGIKPYEYRTPRSPYIYFGAAAGVQALVEHVAYDLTGPSQP